MSPSTDTNPTTPNMFGPAGLPTYVPIYRCKLVREAMATLYAVEGGIGSPAQAAAIFWPFLEDVPNERLLGMALDSKNKPIGLMVISEGILDSSLVHPREVYRFAINCNASGLIVAHNHPSGDPTPSHEDKRVTERLHEAGQLLGIDLLDHVILGANGRHVSLKQLGVF